MQAYLYVKKNEIKWTQMKNKGKENQHILMVNNVGIFSSKVQHFNIQICLMLEAFQNVFFPFCIVPYNIFLCLNYAVYICTVWRPLLQTRSCLLFCLITNIFFLLFPNVGIFSPMYSCVCRAQNTSHSSFCLGFGFSTNSGLWFQQNSSRSWLVAIQPQRMYQHKQFFHKKEKGKFLDENED